MSAGGDSGAGGRLSGVSSWMTSFAGITTAVATIMTSASAILGLLVHHQAEQLKQAHATVSHQAQQIHALKVTAHRSTPAPTPSASPVTASAAPVGGAVRYLSDLSPTVDNGYIFSGQQVIAAKSYPKTISFPCSGNPGNQPTEAYDVAGSTTFAATAGIPDNTTDATGDVGTITFSNEAGRQIGSPIQVSLGHPVKVELNITGVTQLGMTCTGRNLSTNQPADLPQVALGNAGAS